MLLLVYCVLLCLLLFLSRPVLVSQLILRLMVRTLRRLRWYPSMRLISMKHQFLLMMLILMLLTWMRSAWSVPLCPPCRITLLLVKGLRCWIWSMLFMIPLVTQVIKCYVLCVIMACILVLLLRMFVTIVCYVGVVLIVLLANISVNNLRPLLLHCLLLLGMSSVWI